MTDQQRQHDEGALDEPERTEDAEREHIKLRIRRRLPGRRLDKYLHGRFPRISRTHIQRLIKDGDILVNGRKTKASYEMEGGDVIEMHIPKQKPLEIIPEDLPLTVLYEDAHLIAINKDAGIVCHPANSYQTGTVANAVAHYSESLSNLYEAFRPGIVHRLDKYTTGVMLIAKTDEAHWRLAAQFEQRTVQKTYLAVVHGAVPLDSDMIDVPIGAHPVVRDKFSVFIQQNKINVAKSAVTYYEVAERFSDFTLVKLFPKTGRTHQLRVHMSWIKHPIVGDTMYGGRLVSQRDLLGSGSAEPLIDYQALHAWQIEFDHPIEQRRMSIEAPFHGRFKTLMQTLRKAHASQTET